MSFLIDPPWLYATGRAYGRLMPERTPAARAVSRATAGVFLATSISLYLDRPWTRRIWEGCRAQSGRDWMLTPVCSASTSGAPDSARISSRRCCSPPIRSGSRSANGGGAAAGDHHSTDRGGRLVGGEDQGDPTARRQHGGGPYLSARHALPIAAPEL